jgi:hypothetical protein
LPCRVRNDPKIKGWAVCGSQRSVLPG